LNEKGIPTPLVATMMRAPMSRMDILTESEIQEINSKSKLVKKYSELIDRESAYEMLNKKIATEVEQDNKAEEQAQIEKEEAKPSEITGAVTKSVIKVLTSATFIRGAFGILNKLFRK
jgi:hypothetical protein